MLSARRVQTFTSTYARCTSKKERHPDSEVQLCHLKGVERPCGHWSMGGYKPGPRGVLIVSIWWTFVVGLTGSLDNGQPVDASTNLVTLEQKGTQDTAGHT